MKLKECLGIYRAARAVGACRKARRGAQRAECGGCTRSTTTEIRSDGDGEYGDREDLKVSGE